MKKMVRPIIHPALSKKTILGGLVFCSILLIFYYWTLIPWFKYPVYAKSMKKCHEPIYYEKTTLQSSVTHYSKHLAVVQFMQTVVEHPSSIRARHRLQVMNGTGDRVESTARTVDGKRKDGSEKQDSGKDTAPSEHGPDSDHHLRASVTISIALGITSALMDPNMMADVMVQKFPTFTQLLPSFCHTVSCGYRYRFYFAYDVDDAFFVQERQRNMFVARVTRSIGELCPSGLLVDVHMIQCYHKRSPAWAQNDAAYAAYIDGTDYTYRINDDSLMNSEGWVEKFIRALRLMNPPNVGVVGPDHTGGETSILTYDFTHRSHIEVFGVQYPRLFTVGQSSVLDWTGDSWITFVYKPGRVAKLSQVKLDHSMSLGRRYDYHSKAEQLPAIVNESKEILHRYIAAKEYLQQHPDVQPDPTKVIAMSLYGDNYNYTNGAVRNAQLRYIFYPRWTLRIYVPHPSFSPANVRVPSAYVEQLLKLGAEIVYVNVTDLGIATEHINLLVVVDPAVHHFLIRNADQRFSERERDLVDIWLGSRQPFLTIRDHDTQSSTSITPGLYGAVRPWLAKRLGVNVVELLRAFNQRDETFLMNNEIKVTNKLEDVFWDKVSQDTLFFDSACCDLANHMYFKSRTNGSEYFIGEKFDGFGVLSDNETHFRWTVC